MIEFRTLGTLVLREPNGDDIHPVLAQPKRVALLAYLTIARPRGFHRRDTLLALLWPEQDEQHARWALNQALSHLRSELGKEVVPSRGDGEVGVDPERLSCDAAAFEAAIEAGDPVRALELYRGDLLEGFHVSGCGEFERWLEEERVWLRRRAARAASELARREEARGERVAAGHWARRAFALSPDDEGEIRGLIELLDRVGDRAGAIQAYEDFARGLREEYEVEPAPETRALIAAVRTRQLALEASPAVDDGESSDTSRKVVHPTAVVTLPSRAPGSRRRQVLAFSLLALVTVSAVLWNLIPPRTVPATEAASPTTIAVFPFAYRGSSELAYLGEGMVDLLGANLNGAGEIRTVDPYAVLALTRQAGREGWDPEQAGRVATRLRAGSYVLGDVVEAGGRLRISARLQSRVQDETRVQATVEGLSTQLFQLVDALTIELLRIRRGDPGPALVDLAALTTDSLEALKAYLEGERASRAGRYDPAINALKRATRIDTTFALAQYRLATAAGWAGRAALGREALNRAIRHSNRLGDHERRLIEALDAFYRDRFLDAKHRYREIVTLYPNDFEAWFQLGDVVFHGGDRLDGSWLEAREPFERVLSLEPRHVSALWHLSNIATRERKRNELDSLTKRILQQHPEPERVMMARAQRAFAFGDTAGQARFEDELRKASDFPAQQAAGFVTFTTGDLLVGRRLWRLITDPSRSRGFRVLARKTLAQMELMGGRWRAARAELDSMALLDPSAALEHTALFSLWPLQRVPRQELMVLRAALLRWKAAPTPNENLRMEHGPVRRYLRLYLLGLLDARLGEYSKALGYAAELERRASSASDSAFVADLAHTVRAEVARSRRRPDEALQILEQAGFWAGTYERITGDSPFYAREYERFTRAELLVAVGRYDDALRSYATLADNLFHSGAPANLRMAQIYERQGEPKKAAAHYGRFAELWKDCDPEFRPLVEEARQRQRRLSLRQPR